MKILKIRFYKNIIYKSESVKSFHVFSFNKKKKLIKNFKLRFYFLFNTKKN